MFCELFILHKTYTIYLTRKNCFRYLKLMSPLNKWYYFKNNYLTLRSKDKVQRRSLRYATHALWSCTYIPNIIDLDLERQKSCGADKLRWEEAEEVEAEEKMCFPVFRFHCVSDCLPYVRITIQFNSTYSFQASWSCQTVLWSWLPIIIKTYTNVHFKNKI